MRLSDPTLRTALAGEYVLGTLSTRARRRFEHHLARDPVLRGEVDAWQARLDPLVDRIPERTPPDRVWHAIARRTRATRADDRQGLLERIAFWRAGALVAGALSMLLAVFAAYLHDTPPPEPPIATATLQPVAVLADRRSRSAWVVRVAPSRAQLSVHSLTDQPLESGRSFQLWMIPADSAAPRSLGLIPASGTTRLALSREQITVLASATAMAVSVEPEGGSPTGLPTGPIPYQGALLRSADR